MSCQFSPYEETLYVFSEYRREGDTAARGSCVLPGALSGPHSSALSSVYLLRTPPLPVITLSSGKSALKSIFKLHIEFQT